MHREPAPRLRGGLLGFALGVVAGLFLVELVLSSNLTWVLYLLVALTGAMVFPSVARWMGGADRVALTIFVLGLILEVDWWVTYQLFAYPGGVSGLGLNLMVIAGALWVALWYPARRAGIAAAWQVDPELRRAALAFVVATSASVLGAISTTQWLFGMALNVGGVFVALVTCHIVAAAKPDDLKAIWRIIIIALLLEAVLVLLQNALGFTFSLKGDVFDRSGAAGRYSGTYSVPSATGTFLTVGLFFAMMELLLRHAGARRWLTMSAFVTGLLALLLTKTRSAWIGFAGGAAVLGVWAMRSGMVRRRTLVLVAVAGLCVLAVAFPTLASRLGDDHEGDFDVRWNLIVLGLEVLKSHPLFGVGVNNCYLVIKDYVPAHWAGRWVFVPHNQFLLTGAEAGIPGMLAFIWLFVVGLRAARTASRSADPFIRHNGFLLRVVLWSLVWALNLDFVLGSQTYYLVFFMLGMAVGLRQLAERRAAEAGAA